MSFFFGGLGFRVSGWGSLNFPLKTKKGTRLFLGYSRVWRGHAACATASFALACARLSMPTGLTDHLAPSESCLAVYKFVLAPPSEVGPKP